MSPSSEPAAKEAKGFEGEVLARDSTVNRTVSPWVDFLIGKKRPADKFLKKLDKDGMALVDNTAKQAFADALAEAPERTTRAISLIQASKAGVRERRAALELSEYAVVHMGLVSADALRDGERYLTDLTNWTESRTKRPLTGADLALFYYGLQVGFRSGVLDERSVLRLLDEAMAKPATSKTGKVMQGPKESDALEALLEGPGNVHVLSGGLKVLRGGIAKAAQQSSRILELETAVTALTGQLAEAAEREAVLREEMSGLRQRSDQLLNERDGYLHKLDEHRGRMRGLLQGQLSRWLETALDATTADDPFIPVIRERLEDALRLIAKETACLPPSD